MSVSAQGYSTVGYISTSHDQKKMSKMSKESSIFQFGSQWVGNWRESRRRTGDGYLTNFATPSSQRWKWKKRRRDR